VIIQGKAEAVALASILHYNFIRDNSAIDEDFRQEGNIEFLKRGKTFSKIQDATLDEIKCYLSEHGIDCRYPLVKSIVADPAQESTHG
jgi:cyclase